MGFVNRVTAYLYIVLGALMAVATGFETVAGYYGPAAVAFAFMVLDVLLAMYFLGLAERE